MDDLETVKIFDLEINPGKGRGSKRVGRTGVRALILRSGEDFFVRIHPTIAGRIQDSDEISHPFDDLGKASQWAHEALHARKRAVVRP